MSEIKTHYKKLRDPNYIGAYELLQGETAIDLDVTIVRVAKESVMNGEKEEPAMVAHLAGQKPFIVNATNAKTIARALGSPYVEDWAGRTITLYVAKVRAFGENVEALRVRPKAGTGTLKREDPRPRALDAIAKATDAGMLASIEAHAAKQGIDVAAELVARRLEIGLDAVAE